MNKILLIIILLVLFVGLGAWAFTFTSVEEPTIEEEPTTTDPDSSPEDTRTGTATVTARINQGASALGVTIVPLEVTEDSRCPVDVDCIWAGTVRLQARLASEEEHAFVLGESVTTEEAEVTLTAVAPDPISTETILPSEYIFTFTIEKR